MEMYQKHEVSIKKEENKSSWIDLYNRLNSMGISEKDCKRITNDKLICQYVDEIDLATLIFNKIIMKYTTVLIKYKFSICIYWYF